MVFYDMDENDRVVVIGVGITKFGEHFETSFTEDITYVGMMALKDAGLRMNDVEELYIGNMSGGGYLGQEHMSSLLQKYLKFQCPITRVEAACASGGLAFRQAYLRVKSGAKYVVAAGIERMTDVDVSKATDILGCAADREFESNFGLTFPSLYAMIAHAHMDKYGTTREQLAMVSVKNHKNAVKNPCAQFQREITIQNVLNSAPVASPLNMLDCSPISDGAAAVVLTSYKNALKLMSENKIDRFVEVLASEQAHDTISLYDRRDLTTFDATVKAAGKAYNASGLGPEDIDLAEVHDCFTIAEILAIEDLGFCKKGEGGLFVEKGYTEIGSKISVNTSGGLKGCGHPVGATGIKQVVEIVQQLRGKAGERQVKDAKVGLAHNVGGSGGTAVVSILRGVDE